MKGRLLELLRAHWPLVLALALGAAAGWFAHGGRSETITETVDSHAAAAASGKTDSHLARGPVDIEVDVGGWAPPVLPVYPDAPQATPSSPVRAAPPVALWRPQTGLIPDCLLPTLPPGSKIRIHEGPSTEDAHASTQSVATEETHRELKEILAAPPRLSIFGGLQLRPDTRGAGGAIVHLFGPLSAQAILVPDLSDPFRKSTVIVGAVVGTSW